MPAWIILQSLRGFHIISPCGGVCVCVRGFKCPAEVSDCQLRGKHCQQKIAWRQCGDSGAVIPEDETGKAMERLNISMFSLDSPSQ